VVKVALSCLTHAVRRPGLDASGGDIYGKMMMN
jgi:hypothetical protein